MTAPMDTKENAPAGWSPAKGERINESKVYGTPPAPVSATIPDEMEATARRALEWHRESARKRAEGRRNG